MFSSHAPNFRSWHGFSDTSFFIEVVVMVFSELCFLFQEYSLSHCGCRSLCRFFAVGRVCPYLSKYMLADFNTKKHIVILI